jgi:hypothetical protein
MKMHSSSGHCCVLAHFLPSLPSFLCHTYIPPSIHPSILTRTQANNLGFGEVIDLDIFLIIENYVKALLSASSGRAYARMVDQAIVKCLKDHPVSM